jgi:hypothetical protein
MPDGTQQDGTQQAPSVWSRIATYVPAIAAHLAAAAGNYTPLDQMDRQNAMQLRWQELNNQSQLLNSNLQTADLARKREQQQLDNFQTPAQQQAQEIDTAGKLAGIREQYAEPKLITGPTDSGQLGYFKQDFDPTTKQWNISPAQVTKQVPNPALAPYNEPASAPKPNYVTDWSAGPPADMPKTVAQRSQLLAMPKSSGGLVIEPDAKSATGYSHVSRDAFGNEIFRSPNALPPSGFVPKTTTGNRTTVIQTADGPQTITLPSSSTTAPALPGVMGRQPSAGGGGSSPVTRAILNSQGDQVKPQVTAATRSMAEAAPHVLAFLDRIEPLVEQNLNNMGPLQGRWSDFWNNKVGAPDPSYNALRVNDGLLSTLLMRMHTGSRGAVQMQQHFQDLLGLAHQSPENYMAALQEIRKYANDLSGNTSAPASGNTGGTVSLQDFLNER